MFLIYRLYKLLQGKDCSTNLFSEVASVKMAITVAYWKESTLVKSHRIFLQMLLSEISSCIICRSNKEIIKKLIPASARSKNHLHPKPTADLYCEAVLLGTAEICFRSCSARTQSFSDFILQHKFLLNSRNYQWEYRSHCFM